MKIPESDTDSTGPKQWQCPHCEDWQTHFFGGNWDKMRCPDCMSVVEGYDVETRPLYD
jgi:hypothetical protein